MGKKFSQDSVKISKMSRSDKKINLNYRVLRPKVYITDSSTFKTLVQELTGNGNGNGITSPRPSPISSVPSPRPNYFYNTITSKVANIDYGFQESSPELSFDSSEATLSSSNIINIPTTQQLNTPTPLLSSSSSSGGGDDDELQSYNLFGKYDNTSDLPHEYNGDQKIEYSSASCFLGMNVDDPFLYNYMYDDTAYAIPIMPREVCVYDYDLSGIM